MNECLSDFYFPQIWKKTLLDHFKKLQILCMRSVLYRVVLGFYHVECSLGLRRTGRVSNKWDTFKLSCGLVTPYLPRHRVGS